MPAAEIARVVAVKRFAGASERKLDAPERVIEWRRGENRGEIAPQLFGGVRLLFGGRQRRLGLA